MFCSFGAKNCRTAELIFVLFDAGGVCDDKLQFWLIVTDDSPLYLYAHKKKAYLKVRIEELETNSKINKVRDLYRGINDFKKGYQPRTTMVKDEKGDLVADPHSIMARRRNYFSQLLNVHEVKDVRQAEIHTVESLVPEPSALRLNWLLKS